MVWVTTGNKNNMTTNNQVQLYAYGTKSQAGPIPLGSPKEKSFKKGGTTEFKVIAILLGVICVCNAKPIKIRFQPCFRPNQIKLKFIKLFVLDYKSGLCGKNGHIHTAFCDSCSVIDNTVHAQLTF